MNLEYLRHGKALCGKVFRRFVETFNFHNDFISNLNQAILDRLNADERKRKLEKENDKVVRKLDELIKKLEQMSTL